jgi:hypothetical protein
MEMRFDLPSLLVVIVFGLGCIACGVWMMRNMKRAAAKSIPAQAKVVDVECEMAITGPSVYFPVFEFTTAEGRQVRVRSSIGSAQKLHEVGDLVDILYDKENPEELIQKGSPAATFAVLVLFIGIILIGFAISKFKA